ncbi:MAG TPA: class III extradiol ring-cleavage dioxygenase [Fibrobacteria bacterium]|nr:class III extradiol ring-cleavage dioxygenase [Fibrobacteria bacterium]
MTRMPVAFVPHGGGPWPFVKIGWNDQAEFDSLHGYLQSVAHLPKVAPKAVLVISGHWEARVPTVQSHPNPPLLFDYYGFPPEAYQITWPAPGSPVLADRVRAVLEAAGFQAAEDAERGYDHGTFVPLKVTWPEPAFPIIQLSLIAGLSPEAHLRLGQALAPLRDEGVYIVGSGMSYHNLREMFDRERAIPVAEAFDAWLREAATLPPKDRDAALARWAEAPGARRAHPREEHLIPLLVIAGAAGEDPLRLAWNGTFMGVRISAFETA